MNEYYVVWPIHIAANSAREAAQKALEIQRDPTSIATCFEVTDTETQRATTVDLDDPEFENLVNHQQAE